MTVISYGMANYESTQKLKVKAPPRPMFKPPVPVEVEEVEQPGPCS